MKSLQLRLDEKTNVDAKTGCWLWTAGTDKNGYGVLGVKGKTLKAHRVAWELANKTITCADHVLHRCDVTRCVNPAHLFIGTHRDNMADMKAKKRAKGLKGFTNHKAKITPETLAQIRILLLLNRKSCNSIAKEFGLVHSTITRIKRGEGWVNL